jgi:hypothetical protein
MKLKGLTEYLRKERAHIVKTVAVQVEYHDPTYGAQMTTDYIETVDFDALLRAIDEFTEELKEG